MDSASGGGDGRRRGRKGRGRQGRRKHQSGSTSNNNNNNNNNNRSRGSRGHHQPQHEWYAKESSRDDSSVLGGRSINKPLGGGRRHSPEDGPPDAFAMFCAYHLGITPDDGYHEPRIDEVARRYGMKREEINELLKELQLDDESVLRSQYDMVGAKLDMRLAPEGISRTESARELYAEYVEALESAPAKG